MSSSWLRTEHVEPCTYASSRPYHCIRDFNPDTDKADDGLLALKKGDRINVFEEHESGWWPGHKDNSIETAWFPSAYLKPVSVEADEAAHPTNVASPSRLRARAAQEELERKEKELRVTKAEWHNLQVNTRQEVEELLRQHSQELSKRSMEAVDAKKMKAEADERVRQAEVSAEDRVQQTRAEAEELKAEAEAYVLQARAETDAVRRALADAEERTRRAAAEAEECRINEEDLHNLQGCLSRSTQDFHGMKVRAEAAEEQLRQKSQELYRCTAELEASAARRRELEAEVRRLTDQLRKSEDSAASLREQASAGPRQRLDFSGPSFGNHSPARPLPRPEVQQQVQIVRQPTGSPAKTCPLPSPRGSGQPVKNLALLWERREVSVNREPSVQRQISATAVRAGSWFRQVSSVSNAIVRTASQEVQPQYRPVARTLHTSGSGNEALRPLLGMSPLPVRNIHASVTQTSGLSTNRSPAPQRTSLVKDRVRLFENR